MDAITMQWVDSVEEALPFTCHGKSMSVDAQSVTLVFDDAECSLRLFRVSVTGELGVRGIFIVREAGPGLGSWWTRSQRSFPSYDWHQSGPAIAEWLATTLGEARRLLSENGHPPSVETAS